MILDVVYNHLGPEGNYFEKFGPYFTDRYHTPWGKAVNYDGADSDAVRQFVIDNACAVDSRFPPRRTAPRRRANHLRFQPAPHPRRHPSRRAARRPHRAADRRRPRDRRDRSERRSPRSAAGAGRLWAGRHLERRLSPQRSRPADRRARRLLRRFRHRPNKWPRPSMTSSSTTAATARIAAAGTARRIARSSAGGSSSACRTTIRSATGRWATGWARWFRPPASGWLRLVVAFALRAAVVHGRGIRRGKRPFRSFVRSTILPSWKRCGSGRREEFAASGVQVGNGDSRPAEPGDLRRSQIGLVVAGGLAAATTSTALSRPSSRPPSLAGTRDRRQTDARVLYAETRRSRIRRCCCSVVAATAACWPWPIAGETGADGRGGTRRPATHA